MNFNFPCKRGRTGKRHAEVPSNSQSGRPASPTSPTRTAAAHSADTAVPVSESGESCQSPASCQSPESSHSRQENRQPPDRFESFAQPCLWRTTDEFGNIYLTDDNQVRKLDRTGTLSVLAGTGEPGFADGQGPAAQFAYPAGVAVDQNGNIYVADTGNHRIRKIDPAGIVSTLAGSGQPGFADGVGNLAQFHFPLGIASDDCGNVFVADRSNRRVRKIDPNGVVSTVAGSGVSGCADGVGTAAQFQSPAGIIVDAGNLYVSDLRSQLIRNITRNGIVSTITEERVDRVDRLRHPRTPAAP